MKTKATSSIILGCVFVLAMMAPIAQADTWNQRSEITFNAPIRIPGNKVLPAGTYWFKLASSSSDRNVVEVFNSNGSFVTMLITRPTWRPRITDRTTFTMAERAPGQPDVLVKWFYPGRMMGHEFVYSTPLERRLPEDKMITVIARQVPINTQVASAS